MASTVEIANRALQKLGAKRIVSLTEDSRNGRAVSAAFEPIKRAELRSHPWSFAIKRTQLAASSTPPAFGFRNQYPLPSDFLRLLNPDPGYNYNDLDWQIEGSMLLTDWDAPLNFRYVADITDPNLFDPLFRETLASRIAMELCEEITQSNTKKQFAVEMYRLDVAEAKRANAIERISLQAPTDAWITVRD